MMGLKVAAVRRLVHAKLLPKLNLPSRCWLFKRETIERFINGREK